MADLASQPTARPTRKMLAAALSGIATAALMQWAGIAAETAPRWLGWLTGDLAQAGIPVVAAFAVGYLVRDRGPSAKRESLDA